MITIYYRNLRDKALQTVDTVRVGCWIHVEEPTTDELKKLKEQFNLDESLLIDAIDPYEVPRMEVEDDVNYIFSRYPSTKEKQITTSPILFIYGKECFITIAKDKFPILEGFLKSTFFTTQKTKLFLQLIAIINSSYNSHLHTISREIQRSAYEIEKISNKDIAQFVRYERVLSDFHLALIRTNTVLNNLLSHNYIRLYEEDRDLMEDLLLNNDQLIQISKENLKSIVNIRDAYSTIITNNTNRVIRFFTSVTVILTIPMIVASIYGMNVALPFAQAPHVFMGIMTFIGIISVGLVVMFLHNDWL